MSSDCNGVARGWRKAQSPNQGSLKRAREGLAVHSATDPPSEHPARYARSSNGPPRDHGEAGGQGAPGSGPQGRRAARGDHRRRVGRVPGPGPGRPRRRERGCGEIADLGPLPACRAAHSSGPAPCRSTRRPPSSWARTAARWCSRCAADGLGGRRSVPWPRRGRAASQFRFAWPLTANGGGHGRGAAPAAARWPGGGVASRPLFALCLRRRPQLLWAPLMPPAPTQ
jgi:hypothetical protein